MTRTAVLRWSIAGRQRAWRLQARADRHAALPAGGLACGDHRDLIVPFYISRSASSRCGGPGVVFSFISGGPRIHNHQTKLFSQQVHDVYSRPETAGISS